MSINDTSEVRERIEEKYKGYKVKFFESRLGGIYAYAIDNRSETGLKSFDKIYDINGNIIFDYYKEGKWDNTNVDVIGNIIVINLRDTKSKEYNVRLVNLNGDVIEFKEYNMVRSSVAASTRVIGKNGRIIKTWGVFVIAVNYNEINDGYSLGNRIRRDYYIVTSVGEMKCLKLDKYNDAYALNSLIERTASKKAFCIINKDYTDAVIIGYRYTGDAYSEEKESKERNLVIASDFKNTEYRVKDGHDSNGEFAYVIEDMQRDDYTNDTEIFGVRPKKKYSVKYIKEKMCISKKNYATFRTSAEQVYTENFDIEGKWIKYVFAIGNEDIEAKTDGEKTEVIYSPAWDVVHMGNQRNKVNWWDKGSEEYRRMSINRSVTNCVTEIDDTEE